MTIEQTWNNGGYLSGLKGVTIPNNTPSFNEDPRKGRHWSSDNAIQADDESLKGIFASLNSMPTVSQQDVQIPDPQPVSQSQPSEQSVAQQQTTQAIQQSQEAHVFPTTSDRQPVGTGSLQFDEDTDATQQNPAYEEHGPIQQIDSNPPSFVPGATPFAKRQTDIAETAAQQMPPTITHIPQDAAFQRPQPQQQQMCQPQPQTRPFADFVVPETNDADEDAVPEERKIKAEQVEQTLRTEHPDADDEFVSAIRQLVELNASDLHLVINDPPMLRVDGKLRPAKGLSVWTKDHTYEAVKVMTNELEMERFKDDLELDISFAIGDLLRFRVNVYRDRMGVCAALRTIPTEIKTAQELGIDPRIADLALLPRGLVLVCGPTGSGKSTTLAAIVDKANAERADHIITIEDPIEFVHQHKRCVMSQREVGTDTKSFAEALKRALREDPDVILIGEMRDYETISLAMTAAETGHLVFGTLHTSSAAQTVDRISPIHSQDQVRSQLASMIQGIIAQTLIPRADGKGRVAAVEVMIGTDAIRNLIRSAKINMMETTMAAGARDGMCTLNASLANLYKTGQISYETALEYATDRGEMEKKLLSGI